MPLSVVLPKFCDCNNQAHHILEANRANAAGAMSNSMVAAIGSRSVSLRAICGSRSEVSLLV
jgi:hypothetical protein